MSDSQGPTTVRGNELLPQHTRLLTASGISSDVAAARGYRSVHKKADLRRLGFGEAQARVPALMIPIWGVRGEIVLYQARPDQPRIVKGKAIKYETPVGSRMALDVPPPARSWLGEPSRPLFITEGVRKADAAVSKGLCCIALLGVWNWRGSNEEGGRTALGDWESVALNGRQVYVVFDSDVMQKPEVHASLERLKSFLESRHATVFLIYLPPGPGETKVGLDDYLAAGHSVDDLLALASPELKRTPGSAAVPAAAGPYVIHHGQICHVKCTRNGLEIKPLCNFAARVNEEVVLDDGVETTRAFMVDGELDSGEPLPAIRVHADRYASMTWVTSLWGLKAVVRAGAATRDQLREGIQQLSRDVRIRQVFTHTGWRRIGDRWLYLTASGAVGVEGLEVDLGPELSRYRLPRVPEDPVQAMRASLELLKIAPLTITTPLWAATFRAPLASAYPVDLSLWLEGVTGSLKSTFAAVFLCHWGSFERTSLPGAWSSTANSLEKRAFVLKDAVFVIDDYAPSGLDRRDLETKASRLLRAQGNLAGRGRLRADLSERQGYAPRGLVLGTGEQRPSGHSVLARIFITDLDRRNVDLKRLTDAQCQAARLPNALAGYVSWLAPQMDGLTTSLRATFEQTRARTLDKAPHLRVPEALAHLWIGLDCGLAYAEEIKAVTASEAADLRAQCWEALLERAKVQGELVEEERPTRRYLEILATLVTQQRVQIQSKDIAGEGSRTQLIGWHDADFLYLLPDATFQAVSRFARETEEFFPVGRRRIQQDLVREGIAQPDPGRSTTTVRLGGYVRRVIRLRRAAIEAMLGEEFPAMSPVVTGVTGSVE